MQDRLNNFKKI